MTITISKNITDVLNGTIESIKAVLPIRVDIRQPQLFNSPFNQHTIGVLIGITGDIKGRIVIDGEEEVFSKIGEVMFGMPLIGEMLESFAGELGNMIAGNMSTQIASNGLLVDITPPTVIVGHSKIFGFSKAIRLPIQIEQVGELNIILMIEI
ncbi:chemotaxis protein CheX [Bacillus sp. FJAT-49736]|uniref:chemotaxis protein CheX n=1 Tax=Bacillus sp. FJAT-49736 TaxID=2833582 RepID=UPI001BC91E91|nr:chemotaxis protein CheX [Bacillus sp. FJAT-49736]MBS4173222.1 chemotaxis protein CheX [Bacillus sp. FJAT-49736]